MGGVVSISIWVKDIYKEVKILYNDDNIEFVDFKV